MEAFAKGRGLHARVAVEATTNVKVSSTYLASPGQALFQPIAAGRSASHTSPPQVETLAEGPSCRLYGKPAPGKLWLRPLLRAEGPRPSRLLTTCTSGWSIGQRSMAAGQSAVRHLQALGEVAKDCRLLTVIAGCTPFSIATPCKLWLKPPNAVATKSLPSSPQARKLKLSSAAHP